MSIRLARSMRHRACLSSGIVHLQWNGTRVLIAILAKDDSGNEPGECHSLHRHHRPSYASGGCGWIDPRSTHNAGAGDQRARALREADQVDAGTPPRLARLQILDHHRGPVGVSPCTESLFAPNVPLPLPSSTETVPER